MYPIIGILITLKGGTDFMKVIQEGHFEDKMRVVCTGCEAVLEITSQDITPIITQLSIWPYYYYTCPCCNKQTSLKDKTDFTIGIQRAIEEARTREREKSN